VGEGRPRFADSKGVDLKVFKIKMVEEINEKFLKG